MAWYNSTGKENHKSLFDNVEYDRCIFCGGSRTEVARTDFTIAFSKFEYNTEKNFLIILQIFNILFKTPV